MTRRLPFWVIVTASSLLMPVGCVADIFCTYSQEIIICVADGAGEELAEALVRFAKKDRPTSPRDIVPFLTDDEYLDQFGRGETTDASGKILLSWPGGLHCGGGLFPFFVRPAMYPDTLPDNVTGQLYLVRVETATESEILTVEFTPGNTVSGGFFEITVLSIGEPIPVE